MADTPNHEYNVPDQGDQDWHQPLNENFEEFEVDIELRDQEGNLGDYDPTDGAKFLATDTGVVYLGDGTDWNATFLVAEYDDSTGEATISGTLATSKLDVDTIGGSLTGGTELSNIAGSNLSIDSNGTLNASGGGGGGGGGISSLSGGDGIDPASIGDGDTLSVAWGDANDLDSDGNVTGGGGGGGGEWTANNTLLEPSDSNIDGIDVGEVNTAELNGSLTGGTELTSIAGTNLSIDSNGQLNASGGGGGGGGEWTAANNLLEPSDSSIDGIDVDEVNTAELNGSLTGGTELTSIAGTNLSIDSNGQLNASGGGGGNWTANNNLLEPSDGSIDGIDVDEVNAATLAGGGGPLELTVDGARALSLSAETGSEAGNVVAGYSGNSTDADVGAVIAGGGEDIGKNSVYDDYGTISGGNTNIVGSDDGDPKTAMGATIGGGVGNKALAAGATISGGSGNEATATNATVGGGASNESGAKYATVGGGRYNFASAAYATVAGGGVVDTNNRLTTTNVVRDNYGTIGGGGNNQAGSNDSDTTTATFATVAGGEGNEATAEHATVSGGENNEASASQATLGGGKNNIASGERSTLSGGKGNEATENAATVAGGQNCHARGQFATAGGGQWNEPTGPHATIAGGEYNEAYGRAATIAGGGDPDSDGTGNVVYDDFGTIGGGGSNVVGVDDSSDQSYATVSGGGKNEATAEYATVAGGENNVASAQHATVLGGKDNEASGNFSIALGRNATASDPGSLVVGDSTSNSVESVAGHQARFQGSIRSGVLTTESDVWYYPSDADTSADWRTRYDTSNNFWRVDEWTGVIWEDRMWVNSNGDVKATGSKDFVETVETDEGEKKVHYSATESGTAHTEESGVGKLDDGRAEIALPDHFGMVTDGDEPLVVQTTPYGGSSGLKVVEHSTDRLVVEDLDGEGDYEFAYTVKGTRDGYADKEVVREPSASAESPQSPTPADD